MKFISNQKWLSNREELGILPFELYSSELSTSVAFFNKVLKNHDKNSSDFIIEDNFNVEDLNYDNKISFNGLKFFNLTGNRRIS